MRTLIARTIPSTAEDVAKAQEELQRQLEASGYQSNIRFAVRIACEEALTNARVHGNGGDLEKSIHIEAAGACVSPGELDPLPQPALTGDADLDEQVRERYEGKCARRQRADTELTILVQDEGNGFDVSSVPDPRSPEYLTKPVGRGILIMQEMMDSVQYPSDARGTRVIMTIACATRKQTHTAVQTAGDSVTSSAS